MDDRHGVAPGRRVAGGPQARGRSGAKDRPAGGRRADGPGLHHPAAGVDRVGRHGGRDAPAALAALGQDQPDLLVCDIQLGNENGYELVQQARTRGLDCPVIYVTGFAGSDNDDPSPSTLVLYKPFRLVELQTSIDRLFGNLSARPGVG